VVSSSAAAIDPIKEEMRSAMKSDLKSEARAAVFAVCFILLASTKSAAQSSIDPSSALLLNPAGSSSVRPRAGETRLDSGRYTIRPRVDKTSDRPADKTPPSPRKPVETTSSKEPDPAPSATPSPQPTSAGGTVNPGSAQPGSAQPGSAQTDEPQALAVEGSGAEVIPAPEATRMLDISVATVYLYEDAQSSYSYRQETMASPAYSAAARAWLSPEFAVGGSYLATFGGQVADQTASVSASRTETAFGLYLRKLFASSHLTFGVELIDSQFRVSSDAVSKLKTKSSGVRLSMEGEFQSSASSAWLIGFSASPRLQHEEITAATEVRSGTGVNAYAVGASLERRWRFDNSNAMFIRLEHKFERDLFTGSATLADPIGGATPNGVAASVGTTLIQFGYNWGG
jgi:hypothetical protein